MIEEVRRFHPVDLICSYGDSRLLEYINRQLSNNVFQLTDFNFKGAGLSFILREYIGLSSAFLIEVSGVTVKREMCYNPTPIVLKFDHLVI